MSPSGTRPVRTRPWRPFCSLIGAPAGYVEPTALAQIAQAVFGSGPLFASTQAVTAGIHVFAANTAFNGFPVLASLLAHDGYLPGQLHRRGDRLVFSNGIVVLAVAAGALVVVFDADVTRLIQLPGSWPWPTWPVDSGTARFRGLARSWANPDSPGPRVSESDQGRP